MVYNDMTATVERFYQEPGLPFARVRYTTSSTAVFKPHMHTSFSVGAVDTGKVRYTVGAETATLAPGSLALINPETLHSCNPLSRTGRSYYMLYLDVDWCLRLQQSLWSIAEFCPVELIRISDGPLYERYRHTMQQLLSNSIHRDHKEQLLIELMTEIFALACSPHAEPSRSADSIELLKKLLKSDLSKDYTLDSLASQLATNPYTLLRKFKAETGLTPHAYRMNCRIEQAKLLLQQGLEIADTAVECGFFDQSHLHRQFKAMTTVTPQEYKVNFVQ